MDYERLSQDFIKSVNFAVWQFNCLLVAADALIKMNNLDLDSRADVVNTLIRLMEAVP